MSLLYVKPGQRVKPIGSNHPTGHIVVDCFKPPRGSKWPIGTKRVVQLSIPQSYMKGYCTCYAIQDVEVVR